MLHNEVIELNVWEDLTEQDLLIEIGKRIKNDSLNDFDLFTIGRKEFLNEIDDILKTHTELELNSSILLNMDSEKNPEEFKKTMDKIKLSLSEKMVFKNHELKTWDKDYFKGNFHRLYPLILKIIHVE